MIIVDTNVILSFLLVDGITRKIIVDKRDVFMAPEYCFNELWENRKRWNEHELSDGTLKEIVNEVKRLFVMPVEDEIYIKHMNEAKELIEDLDDVPLVALALSVDNEGIWTYNIRHFDNKKLKAKVKVLTTKDVLKLHPLRKL